MTNIKKLAIDILQKDYQTRQQLLKELSLLEKYKLEELIEENYINSLIHA
jgi:hypothetical protein